MDATNSTIVPVHKPAWGNDTSWGKSSFSGADSSCVIFGVKDGVFVGIGDSKPGGSHFNMPQAAMLALVDAMKGVSGEAVS